MQEGGWWLVAVILVFIGHPKSSLPSVGCFCLTRLTYVVLYLLSSSSLILVIIHIR